VIELIEVTVEYEHQTEHAIYTNDGTSESIWIPKSQIKEPPDYDNLKKGDTIDILIPIWLAMDKGLI